MSTTQFKLDDELKFIQKHLSAEGISIVTHWDYSHDELNIRLTDKHHRTIQKSVSRYVIEDGLHTQVIRDMVQALKNFPSAITGTTTFDGMITTNNTGTWGIGVGASGGGSSPLAGTTTVVSNPYSDAVMKTMRTLVQDFNDMQRPTSVRMDNFTKEDRILIYELKRKASNYISNLKSKGDILAGGCFTSWVHSEDVKDYDIFVYNQSSKMTLNSALLDDQKMEGPRLLRYTIRDGKYLNNGNIDQVIDDTQTKAQYVICDYPDREAVINHFDAEHACISYEHSTNLLHVSPLTWHCIKNKILRPHKNNKIAQWRLEKFNKKGFKIETECV